jgi:hypothetical protein
VSLAWLFRERIITAPRDFSKGYREEAAWSKSSNARCRDLVHGAGGEVGDVGEAVPPAKNAVNMFFTKTRDL